MSIVSIILPKMGEAIHEATLIKWHKKKGETISKDESIAEVSTDKIDTEIMATESGIIEELFFQENDIVPVGATMCTISTEESTVPKPLSPQKQVQPVVEEPLSPIIKGKKDIQKKDITTTKKLKNSFLSPLLKKIIEKEKISQEELLSIKGTGQKNRITKDDIYAYLNNQTPINVSTKENINIETHIPSIATTSENHFPEKEHSFVDTSNTEIIEMDRMRKIIAQHMISSKKTSAHVTSFAEVDVTKIVEWRNKYKNKIFEERNIKLTYTPIFLEAVVQSLLKFPLLNSSVDGEKIYIKKNIHLGVATALPNNNLIVPVIKFAEGYNFLGLATQIDHLASVARTGKLLPDQISGGTFTVTNLGSINMMMGTPIIHQPQVAILGLGTIKKRPVVKETPQGDSIIIGHIMYLSFSYDHRIVDGKLAGEFLSDITQRLENFSFPTL